MTVRKIYVSGRLIDVVGVGYESKGDFLERGEKIDVKSDQELSLLLTGASLCTNGIQLRAL
jgi:hypothetical protein